MIVMITMKTLRETRTVKTIVTTIRTWLIASTIKVDEGDKTSHEDEDNEDSVTTRSIRADKVCNEVKVRIII